MRDKVLTNKKSVLSNSQTKKYKQRLKLTKKSRELFGKYNEELQSDVSSELDEKEQTTLV